MFGLGLSFNISGWIWNAKYDSPLYSGWGNHLCSDSCGCVWFSLIEASDIEGAILKRNVYVWPPFKKRVESRP